MEKRSTRKGASSLSIDVTRALFRTFRVVVPPELIVRSSRYSVTSYPSQNRLYPVNAIIPNRSNYCFSVFNIIVTVFSIKKSDSLERNPYRGMYRRTTTALTFSEKTENSAVFSDYTAATICKKITFRRLTQNNAFVLPDIFFKKKTMTLPR